MSIEADKIDLNSDASLVDRVNGAETVPPVGVSVDETLKESVDCDVQVQDSEGATELSEGVDASKSELVADKLRIEGETDLIAEVEAGSMGEGGDDKVSGLGSGEDLVIEREGGGKSECGHDISTPNEEELTDMEVDENPSDIGEPDPSIDVCPGARSNSIAEENVDSGNAGDSGSMPVECEPNSMELSPADSLPCEKSTGSACVSKEESLGGPENHGIEIDNHSQDDENEDEDEDEESSEDEKRSELIASKPEYRVSDLVWAKVRSHPWWPGQIFKPSAATAKAKKYFKKNSFLIAYFGDHTFAWNEASHIRPFRPHFERMEKQSNMEEFHDAIDCALEEVSRRIEYGLACTCISKEAYSAVRTQTIDNSGILEESRRIEGGDRFSSASSFEPSQLIKLMKGLAQSPNDFGISRLQFVTSRAQLLAFNRWKGYTQLPEFKVLGGLLESDADIPISEEVKPNASPSQVDSLSSEDEKPKSQAGSSKRKNTEDSLSYKKEKTLSDFLAERNLKVKKVLGGKGGDLSSSISPSRKRKAVDSTSDDTTPVVKHVKSDNSSDSTKKLSQSRQTFKVGASILRVASQLNGSSPIFKSKGTEKPRSGKKKVSLGRSRPEKRDQSAEVDDSSLAEKIPEEKSDLDCHKQAKDVSPETPNGNGVAAVEPQPEPVDKPSSDTNSEPKSSDQNSEMEADKAVESLNENSGSDEDSSPTALILNFTDLESVPLVENLNKIFSRYGTLNESDTEVLKKSKRAKVVFKRRADAETAFSSAGKYSIFGPSLVSYQLKYLPSKRQKESSGTTKRGTKTAKSGAECST